VQAVFPVSRKENAYPWENIFIPDCNYILNNWLVLITQHCQGVLSINLVQQKSYLKPKSRIDEKLLSKNALALTIPNFCHILW
jgi:hypothetical protein